MARGQLPLFGKADPLAEPVSPAHCPPALAGLAAKLPAGLRMGTSSWSFPGWEGLVFAGRHREGLLAREGLPAYARHPLLRTVGIDRTYYAPVEADDFARYAAQVPEGFRFLVKAPESVVLAHYSDDPRHGSLRGQPNPRFLDAAFAAETLVRPVVEGLGARAGPIVFQVPQQPCAGLGEPEVFAARLHEFLAALPRGPVYAVELRDDRLFGAHYAAALAATRAHHCVNVHPRMPTPRRQREIVPARAGDPLVVRWMLGAGQRYEAARSRYAPFDRLVDPDPDARDDIAALCTEVILAGGESTVVINNKAEGSAPLSAFRLAAEVAARA